MAPILGAIAVEGEIMPANVFPLDSTKPFTDQKILGHNR